MIIGRFLLCWNQPMPHTENSWTNWNLAGMPPQAIRAWCSGFRYCPNPLGIVTAEELDKFQFVNPKFNSHPSKNICLPFPLALCRYTHGYLIHQLQSRT